MDVIPNCTRSNVVYHPNLPMIEHIWLDRIAIFAPFDFAAFVAFQLVQLYALDFRACCLERG